MEPLRRAAAPLADGILFQFLMVGSLSFSHIHDVAAANGQSGWKSWLYPLSIDLLTVAAFRKLRAGKGSGSTWLAFLLGVAASLAANVIDSCPGLVGGRGLDVAIGVWPAVALLVCTLLAHDHETPAETRPETVSPAVRAPVSVSPAARIEMRPAETRPAETPASQPTSVSATVSIPAPRPKPATPAAETKHKQAPRDAHGHAATTTEREIAQTLALIAEHGDDLGWETVAGAIGRSRATCFRRLDDARKGLAAGTLQLPHPPVRLVHADPGITWTPAPAGA